MVRSMMPTAMEAAAVMPTTVESTSVMPTMEAASIMAATVKSAMSVAELVPVITMDCPAMVEAGGAVIRKVPVIAESRVVIAVHATVETAWSTEPRPCADEGPIVEPLRAVVAIWGTAVGRIVIIAIRTDRRRTDVYTERYLRTARRRRCNAKQGSSYGGQS